MGFARLRAAARATERISHLVVSRIRLTRIGVGRGLSEATLHSSRQLRMMSVTFDSGRVMRSCLSNAGSRLRGPPALGGGPTSAVSMEVCLTIWKPLGDLTARALIGAFIGSDSARDGPAEYPMVMPSHFR